MALVAIIVVLYAILFKAIGSRCKHVEVPTTNEDYYLFSRITYALILLENPDKIYYPRRVLINLKHVYNLYDPKN